MGDLLKTGLIWLEGQRKSHMASPVTYCRPSAGSGQAADDEVELFATIGKTNYEVEDESGFVVQAHATDFLIAAADLVLAGEKTLPEPGDRIKVAGESETVIYEVMRLGGESHYRFCDPHRNTLRIHTKQIETE